MKLQKKQDLLKKMNGHFSLLQNIFQLNK